MIMKKQKRNKRRLILGILLLMLAAIPAVTCCVFNAYYSKMHIQPVEKEYVIDPDLILAEDDADGSLEDSPEEEIRSYEEYLKENALLQSLAEDAEELPYDSENVYNILLTGIDARNISENSRSDTMIILSINRETQKIVMTSVMRDIYCTVPGVGNTRLNHAYAYGGVSLLLDTVAYNFGIRIDDYVTVNFYGFMDAIDAVGGVEIEVSAEEIGVMNGYINGLNSLLGEDSGTDRLDESQAGTLLLNGKQALAYSRVRYVGNADFERTSRQRKVLTAVMEKAKSLSLTELNDLMNALLPCVTTSLTQGEVLSLLLHAGEYLNYEVDSGRIPRDGSWWSMNVRGMAVLGIDFSANKEYWLERVYGE